LGSYFIILLEQVATPRAGEERDSDQRTMGVVDPPSDLMDLRSVNLGAEKISLQDLYPHENPPIGEERDSDKRTMRVSS